MGIPWHPLALTDPLGVLRGGGQRALGHPKAHPEVPWGTPRGGQGALEGLKRAHKAALEETFGRRGDIAKSLFLLHEMVHFGLWRGAWASPKSTKRGRGDTLGGKRGDQGGGKTTEQHPDGGKESTQGLQGDQGTD